MKWAKWVGYGLFLAVCIAVGAFAKVALNVGQSLAGPNQNPFAAFQTMRDPRGEFPGQDRLTILVVGQDYNRDRKGMPYTKNSRADTIMLLSANLEGGDMRACSIPRDTLIHASDGVSGKINAVLTRGGIDLLKQTIEETFGLTIDSYVLVKPYAVRTIVDAVGGVSLTAIDDMKYDDSWGQLHVDIPAGTHHLDGVGAEGFVRFRKMNPGEGRSDEEGDLRRTARQQLLVQAMMAAARAPGNLLRANQIIDAGFGQIETNLTRLQCVALAQIFKGSKMGSMLGSTIPGEDKMIGGASMFEMDASRAQATVDWLIKRDDDAVKRLVRIEVRNGTKTKGIARRAADILAGYGYNAIAPGNAEAAAKTTISYKKAVYEGVVRDLKTILESGSIVKEVGVSYDWIPDIHIVIGEDLVERFSPSETGTEARSNG